MNIVAYNLNISKKYDFINKFNINILSVSIEQYLILDQFDNIKNIKIYDNYSLRPVIKFNKIYDTIEIINSNIFPRIIKLCARNCLKLIFTDCYPGSFIEYECNDKYDCKLMLNVDHSNLEYLFLLRHYKYAFKKITINSNELFYCCMIDAPKISMNILKHPDIFKINIYKSKTYDSIKDIKIPTDELMIAYKNYKNTHYKLSDDRLSLCDFIEDKTSKKITVEEFVNYIPPSYIYIYAIVGLVLICANIYLKKFS